MRKLSRLTPLVTLTLSLAALTLFTYPLLARPQETQGDQETEEAEADVGIPVSNAAVVTHCVRCHAMDDEDRMTRISYIRKTPEGWQQTIRRMVALNEVELDPPTAREIVKYLSNHNGLAPEELRPGAFEVERRMIDYKYTADDETEQTCIQCHSMGRAITQRRTKEEWALLLATHRGYYPLVDFQAFRRSGPPQREPGPDGRPPDNRHPMDKAIEHLAQAFPLQTAEWASWSATVRPARLQGTWALSGYETGKGPIYGRVVITADPPADDEFVTEAGYVYARGGKSVARSGRAIVYTGFQWRGRSYEEGDAEGLREVMLVERDWREMSGRWFAGGYDEVGLDITLKRVTSDPMILGVHPVAVKASTTGQEVRIYGANLPAGLSPADIDFGPGMEVGSVVSATPEVVTVQLNVSADAAIGRRDLFVAGVARQEALVVYDKVDAINVTPQAGMARVGGVVFPKQYQQFEAVAYDHGPDGEPDTEDDLNLGPVDVRWSLEEYSATFGDDDIQFVGTIDDGGLFVPAEDGPNRNRSGNRNNVGDVWVVATFAPDDEQARPLRARAHLLVTVPLYLRWQPWGSGQ